MDLPQELGATGLDFETWDITNLNPNKRKSPSNNPARKQQQPGSLPAVRLRQFLFGFTPSP
jgi:hypothetical protein